MDTKPFVSILLPTYNRADLLPRAVESVLAQTFPNWELIIWDDGSTDSTQEVLNGFRDSRIHYSYAGNHGQAYALNQAFQLAHGEYIAILNDDDQWAENKLERQLGSFANIPNLDIVFANYLNINHATGKRIKGFDQEREALQKLQVHRLINHQYLILDGLLPALAETNFIASDSTLLKREAMSKIGPFNESLKVGEDLEFWWRASLLGLTFAYTDDVLMIRNKLPGGLTSSQVLTLQNHLQALDACAQDLRTFGREELLPALTGAYRNAWQNMMLAQAYAGNKPGVRDAFRHSLEYGLRPGTLRLLVEALLAKPQKGKKTP